MTAIKRKIRFKINNYKVKLFLISKNKRINSYCLGIQYISVPF